jgi:hypothetical protein
MNLMTMAALYVAFAFPVQAPPTAAEQLQRGIFAQESAGNTDEAIKIFTDLANSPLTPREIAAQAQYRLIQSQLRKGEITLATREMERLEREFSEYRALISSLASQRTLASATGPQAPSIPTAGPASVTGVVKQAAWQNPVTYLTVSALGKDYIIRLASPNALLRRGLNRDSFKLGDTLTIHGLEAKDDAMTIEASTVTSADGKLLFDRSQEANGLPVQPPGGGD